MCRAEQPKRLLMLSVGDGGGERKGGEAIISNEGDEGEE
jgi:hypothetical protein